MADRVILAGLPFSSASAEQLAARMASARRAVGPAIVVSASADFVLRASRDEDLAADLRQFCLLTPASTPIVWLSRLVGRSLPARVDGADLVRRVAQQAEQSGMPMLLAGNAKVLSNAEPLMRRHPSLRINTLEMPEEADAGAIISHLKEHPAQLAILAVSDPCDASRWICAEFDRLPTDLCLVLVHPQDLHQAATVDSRLHDGAPASRADSSFRETLGFLPVLFHEWLHLIGAKRACLPPHPLVPPAEDSDLPPDRLPDPAFRHRLKRGILVTFDMIVFAACFLVADWVRCRVWMHTRWPQPELNPSQQWYWYLWILPVLMACWPPILASLGLYRTAMPPPTWRWMRTAVVALVLCMVFSTFALFFSRLAYPRMQILLTSIAAPVGFIFGRTLLVAAARFRRWFNDLGLPDYSSY